MAKIYGSHQEEKDVCGDMDQSELDETDGIIKSLVGFLTVTSRDLDAIRRIFDHFEMLRKVLNFHFELVTLVQGQRRLLLVFQAPVQEDIPEAVPMQGAMAAPDHVESATAPPVREHPKEDLGERFTLSRLRAMSPSDQQGSGGEIPFHNDAYEDRYQDRHIRQTG